MSTDELSAILKEYEIVEREQVPVAEETMDTQESLIHRILEHKRRRAARAKAKSPLGPAAAPEAPAEAAPAAPEAPAETAPEAAPAAAPEAPAEAPADAPAEAAPDTPAEAPLPTHALPDGDRTRLIPSGRDGIALEVTVLKEGEAPPKLFNERHSIRVCTFNSFKLRTNKAGLQEQWLMLIATLSTFDIVMVQEVPSEGSIKDREMTRANLLKLAFEHHSQCAWSIVLSEPCGPGNLEVHVALVKAPIKVLASKTSMTAGSSSLDRAPLTIKIFDERFKNPKDRTWVLTSVHFPPKARAKERDSQIKAFFERYATEAAFRLDTPLTEKGARDAKRLTVHHLIVGDFNTFLDESYELSSKSFAPPLLGNQVATTIGLQSYDNFVMSKFAANKFALGVHVLELAMPLTGLADALSDHHPVVLKIADTSNVKRSTKAADAV